MAENLELFLRFAEGCRCYLEDTRTISQKDNDAIKSGRPGNDVIKRVFYMAHPELEQLSRSMRKSIFDESVLMRFYCFEHNKMMHEQGHFACMCFPGTIVGRMNDEYVIELEPIDTALRINAKGLGLQHGDWVLVHRMNIVENIDHKLAKEAIDYLKRLGMDKHLKFPPETIKYMAELKDKYGIL